MNILALIQALNDPNKMRELTADLAQPLVRMLAVIEATQREVELLRASIAYQTTQIDELHAILRSVLDE